MALKRRLKFIHCISLFSIFSTIMYSIWPWSHVSIYLIIHDIAFIILPWVFNQCKTYTDLTWEDTATRRVCSYIRYPVLDTSLPLQRNPADLPCYPLRCFYLIAKSTIMSNSANSWPHEVFETKFVYITIHCSIPLKCVNLYRNTTRNAVFLFIYSNARSVLNQ